MTGQRGRSSKHYRQWVVVHQPRPLARLRLFCFPHAGSGASAYREWHRALPEDVEVCAVQLPGRENRLREQTVSNMADLVGELSDVLESVVDQPYAFFGHSVGALIAFELARGLPRGQHTPIHLFLSGRNAPQCSSSRANRHQLSDRDLLDELRRIQGTPEEILDNQELMTALMPALRADFALDETYVYQAAAPLECPIHVFGGTDDTFTSRDGLDSWREQTVGPFQSHLFSGDHFFIVPHRLALLSHITHELADP